MKTRIITLLSFCLYLTGNVFAHGEENHLSYIENKGQWPSQVTHMAKIGGGNVWLEKDKFTFSLLNQEDVEAVHEFHHHGGTPVEIRGHAYSLNFIQSNPSVKISSADASKVYHNYFIGNDQSKWASNVKLFQEVKYSNLYNGVDVLLHSTNGWMKYDFIVSPGTDVNIIKWKYEGIQPTIKNGKIVLSTQAGDMIEEKPIAWQMIDGNKKMVSCEYEIKNNVLQFNLPEGYDATKELIIDPTLIFSSYTGSTADNWGFTATYDNSGNLYSGSVGFSAGYPTVGAFQTGFGGGTTDACISKFNSTGNNLIFSTYLGGSSSDAPHSLIVDATDNLFVLGTTGSSNFPVTTGCYDNTFNGGANTTVVGLSYGSGSDIFVSRFNAAGNALVASTFVGGTGNDGFNLDGTLSFNYADEMRGEIVLANNGDILVASSTLSNNFPTTAGSLSQIYAGTQDAVAFRMNGLLSTMNWSTYIGGSSGDAGYGIKEANTGVVYVTGGTMSNNFPITAGSLQTTLAGGADGYVISFNGTTGARINCTYLGTGSYDQSYLVEIDLDGDIYVTGQTKGAWPVSGGVYSNNNGRQFVHKLNPALNGTIFSTRFGTGGTTIDISPTAFLVDNCFNIYISGWGGSTNVEGSTTGLPVTGDAYQGTTSGSDFYFIVFERDAQSLLYGTFFGGAPAEHVDGGTSRFDKNGVIYQAVCAGCGGSSNFPTQPGVWSTTNGSSNCNLGVIKMEFNFLGINADANAAPNIIACDPPYDVNFTGGTAVHHIWDFDDGTPNSTLQNPSHTFTAIGTYNVMYIAIDSSTCNIADTAYLTVEILQPETFAATLEVGPYDPCTGGPYEVNLEFTGSGADSLIWNMGDGNIYNDTLVDHFYTSDGTYIITLTAYDFTCNLMETITDTVSFNSNSTVANANASPNVIACDPPFVVNYTGGSTPDHYWDFGDGVGTSTLQNPSYTFTAIGNYTVMYVGIDSSTCNISDTVYLSVEVLEKEEFSATFSPIPPQFCSDTVLVNVNFTGSGADSLIWNMGDGTIFTNDTMLNYFYTIPGSYIMTLTAFDFDCNETGTISQTIVVGDNVTEGTVFVPNVITPNGDNINDKFKLGYLEYPGLDAMAFMEFYEIKIYNRWGKLVFESNTPTSVWGGEIESDDASEGVYYYIVNYQRECLDIEPQKKTGYVTVLRE